jgi:hypothetical protein
MPRDNLADSWRTMIKSRAVSTQHRPVKSNDRYRTDRSLCLENPRPNGGIFLPFGENFPSYPR